MDNVETGDEDVRKNWGAIPSAKAVNPHQQQQQQQQQQHTQRIIVRGFQKLIANNPINYFLFNQSIKFSQTNNQFNE